MGHKKHRIHSKVTALPEDIREQLNRLLLEGITYEEAAVWCKDQGFEMSKSAVGRYGRQFFEAYQNVIRFEDQAKAMTGDVGEGLNLEEATGKLLMQKILSALITSESDIFEQHRMIQAVAALQNSAMRMEKLKIDIGKEMERRTASAAKDVEKITRKAGLKTETVDEIKQRILGISEK